MHNVNAQCPMPNAELKARSATKDLNRLGMLFQPDAPRDSNRGGERKRHQRGSDSDYPEERGECNEGCENHMLSIGRAT